MKIHHFIQYNRQFFAGISHLTGFSIVLSIFKKLYITLLLPKIDVFHF